MTFDARESKTANGPSGFMFGGMVALLAGCVFAAIFSLPQPSSAHAQHNGLGLVAAQQFSPDKMSDAAKHYFSTLERVAPQEHTTMMARISTPLPVGENAHDLAAQHGINFLHANLSVVASIPTHAIDAALDKARAQLWMASHEKNPLCAGQFYPEFLSPNVPSSASVNARVDWIKTQNTDVAISLLSTLIEAVESIEQGINKPESRGSISNQDRIVLSGLRNSLASDEQLTLVLSQSLSPEARLAAIKETDSCQLAATAISAIKTLPQDTKGRAFSDAVYYFSNEDATVGDYILQTFF